ncbi:alpha/beta hydrolase [Pedobacter sp. Leaf250]|uniref:alpha/beta hydrolase n=1 Tax=Pedobacter sp. Leaf250 TaxID=2876559 RepID=UPI001E3A8EA1|nr:alpha/beta hydrolase [Pedobacter sp. Leaf250]
MKKFFAILLFFLLTIDAQAQNSAWRTGVRDTSYSSQGDYRSNKKKYPFIKLVTDQPQENVKEKRNLVYSKSKDRKLHIDAFLPTQLCQTPAVIIVHGGGWRSGDRSQHIPLAQRLAARGIASFTIEYRLSTEAFYPAAVFDLKASVRWLKANADRFNIDTAKIAILGFSAGGQLASLIGVTAGVIKLEGNSGSTKYSSTVNAVINIDGTLSFIHPESWEAQNQNSINASAMWLGYPRTQRLDLWAEASPLNYAEQNKVPFLFLNSSIERMHAGRNDFQKIMDQKGIYTDLKTFKDSPHSFCLYQPWFDLMVDDIVSFIKKVFN